MADAPALRVTVAFSPAAREVLEREVSVPAGATVARAIEASGLLQSHPELNLLDAEAGVWGQKAPLDQPLREGDRVEVYRPLKIDPKVARRERFRGQGARATGLFAKRRPGAKPGY